PPGQSGTPPPAARRAAPRPARAWAGGTKRPTPPPRRGRGPTARPAPPPGRGGGRTPDTERARPPDALGRGSRQPCQRLGGAGVALPAPEGLKLEADRDHGLDGVVVDGRRRPGAAPAPGW